MRVLLITDRRLMAAHHGDFRAALTAALPHHRCHSWRGDVSLLIRDKDAGANERRTLINIACEMLPDEVPLLVSGHLPDGLAPSVLARLAGLHAPEAVELAAMQRDLATWARPALLGCSRHSIDGVLAAAGAGANYIQFGPVWATPSKRGLGQPLGLAAVQQARAALHQAGATTRLIAVGGIVDGSFAVMAREAGADGVAVIRGVWSSPAPADQLGHMLHAARPLAI